MSAATARNTLKTNPILDWKNPSLFFIIISLYGFKPIGLPVAGRSTRFFIKLCRHL
jgi:hypothetical protein